MKSNDYIRITNIEIRNIKNVSQGKIDLPIEKEVDKHGRSNVFGIYGPNGTGKTSLITAVSILRNFIVGNGLDDKTYAKYLKVNTKTSYIGLDFAYICDNEQKSFRYELELSNENDELYSLVNDKPSEINIQKETLSYLGTPKNKTVKKFFAISFNTKTLKVAPNTHYVNFFNDKESIEQFFTSKIKKQTFVFSNHIIKKISENTEFGVYASALKEFTKFMSVNLFVVDQSHNNDVFLNVNYRVEEENYILQLNSSLINSRAVLPQREFGFYKKSIDAANVLLESLIDNIQIKINDDTLFETMLPNNTKGISFELVSIRDGNILPLSLESNGIKSLFSVASLLVTAYNSESVSIFIDEFDSGIFEYLLGSILDIYKESGKGLFVFTSHNLRPLEILGKNQIYFAIDEPENKFVKFPYLQPGSNLRNQYIKSLFLGSSEDIFSFKVKKGDIRRAFLKAVNLYNE